ncbi:hypothetical protein EDC18_1196 [Natranaerovirga pectinivora]|uniref:Uncharacterized protein n=1 Tax=Natranaerovirga pectinivora TaxID=682400 RepID=A0A4V2UZJ6_9FIRM|nr:hypothetical protein [Natranaerovirga pectinivora]TCT11618.1 hypothetical protein EDC18_1196 [Natranaerovirga pectinivora]
MKRRLILGVSVIIILLCVYLYKVGYVNIWINGMGAIFHNTEHYTDVDSEMISETFRFKIDLMNLETNEGIEVFNDGVHTINVNKVGHNGSVSSGGYYISFAASGIYSIEGASLISAIESKNVGYNISTTNLISRLKANYKGIEYDCSLQGIGGLGDSFSFYIFPSSAYDNGDITLNETGVVELELINLYKNVWRRID